MRTWLRELEERIVLDAASPAPEQPDATEAEAPPEPAPATEPVPTTEIVFVDSSVPDPAAVAQAAGPDREVVFLDPGSSGLEQIAEHLEGRTGIDAIHVVSHGGEGHFLAGSDVVWAETAAGHAETFQAWAQALAPGGDVLLYACDLAASDSGQQLVADLAAWTGADVAASDDHTGGAAAGGDSSLEFSVGDVSASPLDLSGTDLRLATITVTSLADDLTADGQVTLREALRAAETDSSVDGSTAGSGADTIVFASGLEGGRITFALDDTNRELGPTALVVRSEVTIAGKSQILDGNNARRLFTVTSSGNLTLRDMYLVNGMARGGNGGTGATGGGGGAGLGGAIDNAGTLLVDGVTFRSNTAQGGNGGNGTTAAAGTGGGAGGGGVGGNGGNGAAAPFAPFAGGAGGGGGGTIGAGAATAAGNNPGGAGGSGGTGGSAGANGNTSVGGAATGAGGGGAGTATAGNGGRGGNGGYGGGGGAGGGGNNLSGDGGDGGFGGGGGGTGGGFVVATSNGGSGGFGGGGGGGGRRSGGGFASGTGGFGGGNGGTSGNNGQGGGGGGAGLGGAIFNRVGTLIVRNSTFEGNTAQGGAAGNNGATAGQGMGGAIFLQGGFFELTNNTFANNVARNGNGSTGTGADVFSNGSSARPIPNVDADLERPVTLDFLSRPGARHDLSGEPLGWFEPLPGSAAFFERVRSAFGGRHRDSLLSQLVDEELRRKSGIPTPVED